MISVSLASMLEWLSVWICTIFLLWDSPAVYNLPFKAISHFSLWRHHYCLAGFRTHVAVESTVYSLIIICALNVSVCKTKIFAFLKLKRCYEILNCYLNWFHLNHFFHLSIAEAYTYRRDAPDGEILKGHFWKREVVGTEVSQDVFDREYGNLLGFDHLRDSRAFWGWWTTQLLEEGNKR